MISTNDFKKGLRYEHEGAPWQIMEHSVHNPSARGAATLVKVKSRNMISGQVLQKTFKSGEMFNDPNLEKLTVQYLYDEAEDVVFMDQETYEQHHVSKEKLGDAHAWLTEGFELQLLKYDGEIINIELPSSVEASISSIEMGAKGDTASGKVLSRAILDNGVSVMVPAYLKEGSRIKVDPSSNEFMSRL